MVYNIFFTNKELIAEYLIINLNQGVFLNILHFLLQIFELKYILNHLILQASY
jgi:hypothetical protein